MKIKIKRRKINGEWIKIFILPLSGKPEKPVCHNRLFSNGESLAVRNFIRRHEAFLEKI